MEYVLLKDVTQESHRWRVRVRATRFSEYADDSTPRKVLRLDFVLLDEQGNTMEAQIPGRHLAQFNLSLKENNIYFSEYLEVANAKASYQAIDCPIMARFTTHTKINEITAVPNDFPEYVCTIVSFDVLRTRLGQNQFLSDTIGLITGISHIKTVLAKGITKTIRNINITDGRGTACVTLWGTHATEFDAPGLQTAAENGPVVVLFVGLTARLHEGQLSLQGSTIYKWYTNTNLPEVLALQNSFSAIPHQIKWFGQTQSQMAPIPMTVHELTTLNAHEAVGRTYTVAIAIKELTPNEAWWYLACGGCKRTTTRTVEGLQMCKVQ